MPSSRFETSSFALTFRSTASDLAQVITLLRAIYRVGEETDLNLGDLVLAQIQLGEVDEVSEVLEGPDAVVAELEELQTGQLGG